MDTKAIEKPLKHKNAMDDAAKNVKQKILWHKGQMKEMVKNGWKKTL